MTLSKRLPVPFGSRINREQVVAFQFENASHQGLAGDTVASALAAESRWLLSRSFKYHRPRGILTLAGQDANTLVSVASDPNCLADRELISEGLEVFAQNYNGTLERDWGSLISWFGKFLPVGFYYKAFFKPRGIWELWAPFIRKRAGLGRIDTTHLPTYHDKQYRFCDVAVIGAGPAGMQAALEAAKCGAEVILVDENPELGGSLNYSRLDIEGVEAAEVCRQLIAEVEACDGIAVMCNATCNGWFADNWLAVIQGNRLHKTRAREVIMCVGSLEQPAIFHNNDLPGVMMSSAAQRLMRMYAVRPGRAAVVLTGNNQGYAAALDLLDAGVEVKAIVDLRAKPEYDAIAAAVILRGINIETGSTVYEAHTGSDKNHLGAVEIREILGQGVCRQSGQKIECDLLCMSVGFVPAWQLICQAGGQLSYDDSRATFTLDRLPQGFQIAGSVNGHWELNSVRSDAKRVAIHAARALGLTQQPIPESVKDVMLGSINIGWPIFPHPNGKEFVDFDEDLQIADIVNATRDGYEHIQLVKRYSTCGMGPSQGRHSALATARLVANATGKTVAETGVTTARPPFAPERLAHSAGRSFYPERRSNMHYRHLAAGAQMLQAGAWYRPAYYGRPDNKDACIKLEVENVRTNVGLVDVSTLGGLEVRGPDAGEFLNRIYTYGFVLQPVGRARYALLTNDAGVVLDDGVACRFADNHYYVTATTGGVDRVFQTMLKWNAQWRLNVDIANVTSAWCGINIAGPLAREVLQKLCQDVELDAKSFPYMGVREGTVAGIPARIIRVGFVGELGYEVHVPQLCGEALWDALITAGEEQGIKPFGIEAQRILRLEKGHVIVGQDTDAMSNPIEIQMGWAVSRKKPFFVGSRTIKELEKAPLKRVLAGFVINDPNAPIPLESHLVVEGEQMTGRVTSCNYSPTLGKPIGLAYVPPERSEAGQQIEIKSSMGIRVIADIVALPFYDPDNQRQEL
ncbi:MAG: sarcosine oxidase subunit alpha [Halieaceae bacterium]|jgi:sarcosine oxidase subunit alpha